MSAKPHAVYLNPVLGVVYYCPVRQTYPKLDEQHDVLHCRVCGKALKADKRGH